MEAHLWIVHAVARTKYPDEVQISVEEHKAGGVGQFGRSLLRERDGG